MAVSKYLPAAYSMNEWPGSADTVGHIVLQHAKLMSESLRKSVPYDSSLFCSGRVGACGGGLCMCVMLGLHATSPPLSLLAPPPPPHA